MSNVAILQRERAESPKARDYLGPADVTKTLPHEVEVRLPQGELVRARLALAFTYEPQPNDVVLVIGNADGHYVIGVLHGTGRAVMGFPGDVELRAVGGVLHLAGDKGVRVDGPEVDVKAGTLRIIAGSVAQKFAELRQHVTDLLSVRAGRTHTVVDDSTYAQSKSATIVTEEKVTINGKSIYLG
jgi:hypothetical protein